MVACIGGIFQTYNTGVTLFLYFEEVGQRESYVLETAPKRGAHDYLREGLYPTRRN